jgi:hypothetical protein
MSGIDASGDSASWVRVISTLGPRLKRRLVMQKLFDYRASGRAV